MGKPSSVHHCILRMLCSTTVYSGCSSTTVYSGFQKVNCHQRWFILYRLVVQHKGTLLKLLTAFEFYRWVRQTCWDVSITIRIHKVCNCVGGQEFLAGRWGKQFIFFITFHKDIPLAFLRQPFIPGEYHNLTRQTKGRQSKVLHASSNFPNTFDN